MNLRRRFGTLPLFWKVYIFIVGLLTCVVTLAEFLLEPLLESFLQGIYEEFQVWHEVAIWAVSILLPSLACGYLLSGLLSNKLGKMAATSRALAAGRLEARLPVTGNERDDFDILASSFNDMAKAIERQIQNERRLLADISHELRSPLARMSIAVQLLPRKREETERRALLLRLERELELMGKLVEMLLRQAKERMQTSAPSSQLDLSLLLDELLDDFSFLAKAQGKSLEAEYDRDLMFSGNRQLLLRMFGNIFANALFYTPEGGKVIIRGQKRDGEFLLLVRDFGCGVQDDELEDIFRPFYRADRSRARTSGGVGLGLTLAWEAATFHGGGISARNAEPGLELTVWLPLYGNVGLPAQP